MKRSFDSHLYEYERFKSLRPSLAYDGAEDFSLWQKRARDKLASLLGLPWASVHPPLVLPFPHGAQFYFSRRSKLGRHLLPEAFPELQSGSLGRVPPPPASWHLPLCSSSPPTAATFTQFFKFDQLKANSVPSPPAVPTSLPSSSPLCQWFSSSYSHP